MATSPKKTYTPVTILKASQFWKIRKYYLKAEPLRLPKWQREAWHQANHLTGTAHVMVTCFLFARSITSIKAATTIRSHLVVRKCLIVTNIKGYMQDITMRRANITVNRKNSMIYLLFASIALNFSINARVYKLKINRSWRKTLYWMINWLNMNKFALRINKIINFLRRRRRLCLNTSKDSSYFKLKNHIRLCKK
jgi:hypothetical protein